MKKKLLYLSSVVIILAMIGVGTLAYFTSRTVTHNVITSGGVSIELVEKHDNGDTIVDWPEDGISGVMPGESVSKIVSVTNLQAKAWIRVSVEMTMTAPDGSKLSADVLELDYNTTDWVEQDGYYYYRTPVESGASTANLFETVHFDGPGMDNKYQGCTTNIIVSAQAVQYANNEAGNNVLNVQGWPKD